MNVVANSMQTNAAILLLTQHNEPYALFVTLLDKASLKLPEIYL